MSRLIPVVVTAMMFACLPCAAQPAAAEPATQPAVVAVDQSTPRGALKVLTTALDEGDVAGAQAVFLVDDPKHQPWLDQMLRLAKATALLRTESVRSFGEEGARGLVGDTRLATTVVLASLDRSTEEIDGETAVVRSEGNTEPPIGLRRVDGRWRVPLEEFIGKATPAELEPIAAQMATQSRVIESFCTDLAAGKFKTPDEAAQALQHRRVAARFDENAPATQPATSPSSN